MTSEDMFIERVQRELSLLTRRDSDLAKREDGIKKERASIRVRTAELSRVVALYKSMMGPAVPTPTTTTTVADAPTLESRIEPTNGTSAGLATTADIAAEFMAAHGGQAKIRDILDELVRVGKLPGKEGDYGSVFGALKRNPNRFVKIAPGEFALVERAPLAG